MAKITIPCLVGKTNKAGVTSWYWQPSKTLAAAGWRPVSLGKNMTVAMAAAQSRNEDVAKWKAGAMRPGGIERKDPAGTFGALIQRYRREVVNGKKPNGKDRLAEKTREAYETGLKRLEIWAGKHPIAYITPARVQTLRDANAKPVDKGGIGHSATYNMLKTLRQVMAFAERRDIIPKGSNPATNFELGAPAPRRTIWEADDDAAFTAAAYKLGMPNMALALELALYTAQREGDLIKMTEAQVTELNLHSESLREKLAGKDGKVMGWVLSQKKTSNDDYSVDMAIPLEPEIRSRVEAAIRTNRARDRAAEPQRLLTYVLVDDKTGLPWDKRGFIRAWTKILETAAEATKRPHMTDLVWHDLRRTRVVRLRRRSMPKEMIAAITGHSLQSINAMLKVYGPIDATITAAAIADSLDTPVKAKPADDAQEQSA
ncbi:hypothetical protein [Novosphingobium sp. BL-52-GroH]|uniref:hypothetical protein n=1 Tax=Novosphingobium sp. BL-52-GroH TaxID=3349877 RepID=UPI00384A4BDE